MKEVETDGWETIKDELDEAAINLRDGIEAILESMYDKKPLPQKELVWLRQSVQDAYVWLDELTRQLSQITA